MLRQPMASYWSVQLDAVPAESPATARNPSLQLQLHRYICFLTACSTVTAFGYTGLVLHRMLRLLVKQVYQVGGSSVHKMLLEEVQIVLDVCQEVLVALGARGD